ncbi:MAG TPA: ATP-dependent helicase [bacterium (Candidatus Stahlbacteria)]|nr:ATP-dependent helicase [Candidatus Stahlbacteria bacterium]
MKDKILADLDPDQVDVVKQKDGPMLVVAGPGSGKTKALTRRIANIIINKWARPEEIVALTFTDAAANEMKGRVDELVPYGYVQTWISTFHTFGKRIITEFGPRIGLDPELKVITHPELFVLLSENIFTFGLKRLLPISNPEKNLPSLINHLSKLKSEDIQPDEYLEFSLKTGDERQIEIAQFFKQYDDFLRQRGVIDINGLISTALFILREVPEALPKLEARYRYILVDEFQDTNFAQYQLLKLLTNRSRNICVVGDDDQSIFKFQGAAITNILSFKDDYPDAKIFVLKNNYRSLPELAEVAYRLIRNNDPDRLEVKLKIDKKIDPQRSGKGRIDYFFYETIDQEADSIARMVIEEHGRGTPYSEMAILVRNNRDADPIIRSLNLSNVKWRFSGNQGLFGQEEIQILLSFLNAVADPEDTIHLYHLLCSGFYSPNGMVLNRALARARKTNRPLITIIRDDEFLSSVDDESKAVFEKAVGDIEHYCKLALEENTGKVLYQFLKDKAVFNRLMEEGIEGEVKIKNISRFFSMLRRLGGVVEVDRVPILIDKINLLRRGGENPPVAEADLDIDAINILTVHSAKGKEFKRIFVAGLYQGNFPTDEAHRRSGVIPIPDELLKEKIPRTDHLQEERRLFYVAITRARDAITLTGSRDVGGKRPREPSQFIAEAMDLHKHQLEVLKGKGVDEIKISEHGTSYTGRKVNRITAGQVDDYLTCPLKYKFIHILRVPITRHHAVIFGMAVHAAIAYLLRAKLEQRTPTLDRMIKVFRNNWSSEGFLSREHEDLSFRRGVRIITDFFNKEIGEPTPSLVEEGFSFSFGDIRIVGRWDRVDLDDGGVVIDYKTSEDVDQKKADREARDSTQLLIYAMAFKEIYGQSPKGAELRFVDTGITGQMKRIGDKIKKGAEKIQKVVDGVTSGNFNPKPKFLACRFCAYSDICPYEKKRC